MASGPINPNTGAVVGTAVGGPGVGTAIGTAIGWLGQQLGIGSTKDPQNNTVLGMALPSHIGTRLIAVIVAIMLLTVVAIRLTVEG